VDLGDIAAMTLANQIKAVCDVINGDTSSVVSATPGTNVISLVAKTKGTDGNAITLSVTEVAPNQDDLTVSGATLTGGGLPTETPEENCKVTLSFPQDDATWGDDTFDYDEFAAAFDTVEIFRSIDLADATSAIMYKETTVAMPETEELWDSLQVVVGSVHDESLTAFTAYNPATDVQQLWKDLI
jgi:hypothetical protein